MSEFHVFQKVKLWAFEYAKNPCKNEIEYIKRTIYNYKKNNPLIANVISYEYDNINKVFDEILKNKNITMHDMNDFLENIHNYIMDAQSRKVLDVVFS